MIKRNVKLKAAMYVSGKTQTLISKETGIPESYLSMACSGRLNLNPEQQVKIANAVGLTVNKIFPSN